MSSGKKQVGTVVLILLMAICICLGGVAGARLLTGEIVGFANPPVPTVAPTDGVLVTAVLPESPAASANLRPGHILLRLGNDPITSPEMLTLLLQNLPPGETYTLLVRDEAGEIRQTTAVRAAEPPLLGVEIVDLPLASPEPIVPTNEFSATAQPPPANFQLPTITGIVPESPAANLDMQIGDVITAVDGAAILQGAELLTIMVEKTPGQTITLTLRRDEFTLVRTAVLAAHPENPEQGFLGIEFQP